MTISDQTTTQQGRLLQLLSTRYPTITAAHIEMINLNAIMALPKGTDHFISDIHGADKQFDHILRHASGAIRRKVAQTFGDELSEAEQVSLAMLIYYPEQKLHQMLAEQRDSAVWMLDTIARLARVARTSAQKYTRSKVRKRLPAQLAYILEELLTETHTELGQKEAYYANIVHSVVALGEGETFIVALAYLIHRLVIDRLFILGDIYDRGPAAEHVVERLMNYHAVAILWGNHDVSWMGAASGCDALIANVLRLALRYATLETLGNGYGINLAALARFADAVYGDDACTQFQPKSDAPTEGYDAGQIARMHKAIAVMQFKLEAQIIKRHPEFGMQDRLVLDALDLAAGTISLYGTTYALLDTHLPTLDASNHDALSDAEAEVIADLRQQFQHSARLDTHMRFLYSYGSMARVQDGNLLFHGCLPVDEQGNFVAVPAGGDELAGPALFARYEQLARAAYFAHDETVRQAGQDALWYLWCGPQSPLFGRTRMTTFERYFVADEATHVEAKGPYYRLRHDEGFCRRILAAFGANSEQGVIINGHTPVKARKGESPLLAHGHMIIIDGGMSKAYQPVTGIAGYTLISNSHELVLAAHEAFTSTETMIRDGHDVTPHTEQIKTFPHRLLIADTDIGAQLRGQLEDLDRLVEAYRSGTLAERTGDNQSTRL